MEITNIKEEILKLPTTNGVYLFKKKDTILYIGKSVNLKARVLSHLENAKLDNKEMAIVTNADIIEYIVTDSELSALLLEARLINDNQPKYNVVWRDDKSNLYIQITVKEKYPKINAVRKTLLDKNALYFGPFSSSRDVEAILSSIRKIFPYCSQKNISKTPCFYSKINLCNPCPNIIEKQGDFNQQKESIRKYRTNTRKIISVLSGKIDLVLRGLCQDLKIKSQNKQYEESIIIRDKIIRFNNFLNHKIINDSMLISHNLTVEKMASLLKLLQFNYKNLIHINRIECFDISNLGMTDVVASMVVLTDGLVDKSQYKRFKIKDIKLKSDFERINEVMMRRFKHNEWSKPDLVVVDGGRPQVRVVQQVLNDLNMAIPIVGIAKNPDRIIVGTSDLITIRPSIDHMGFNLLKLIRDESHRFARKYHLLLRRKKVLNIK